MDYPIIFRDHRIPNQNQQSEMCLAGKTVRGILLKYSSYFRRLNESSRERFVNRLATLLQHLEFESQHMDSDVSMEMKLVIASAQIQLTFGLDSYLPKSFDKIVVLPSAYRISSHDKPLIGHVDPKRSMIYLSWEDVQHGFAIEDDAINVALHEFAHWLELESRRLEVDESLLCKFEFSDWRKEAQRKLIRIRANEHVFLKDYGGRNMLELFAVCVEAFFERSSAFKVKLPKLYQPMVELLNQDPSNGDDPLI